MDVAVHHRLCNHIALRSCIKGRAAIDVGFGGGNGIERTFRVGASGFPRHADERRRAGQRLKAAGAAAGAARGIGRVKNDHMSGLGCGTGVAGQQFAAQYNACADTSA